MDRIREAARSTLLLDSHAHNIVGMESSLPLLKAFSEAEGEALEDAFQTLSFKRSVRDLASLYGVEPSLDKIESYRKIAGLESITRKCFEAAGIHTVLMDDGLCLDKMKEIRWHESQVPCVRRVLRIEAIAEEILTGGPPGGITWTIESFLDRYLAKLKSAEGIVAFKSIAAYRSGLSIDPNVLPQDAEQALMCDMARKPLKILSKPLVDFLFVHAMEVACLRRLPIQIHTGFGDKDLDLRLANPLHLRAVLEDGRFLQCRLVLLHGSYPFVQEASYLASVYKQVYLDFGLAIPKLSIRGMENTVSQLLELAPLGKVMFSTDGYAFPETFYLGAKWGREVLEKVFSSAFADGDLTPEECVASIEGILQYNASAFYGLEPARDKHGIALPNPAFRRKEVIRRSKQVRLIWCDNAGQRMCRVVPNSRFESFVTQSGVGLVECCMGFSAGSLSPAEGCGLTAAREVRLIPDLSTRRSLPWCSEHDVVLVDMHVEPGKTWELCPRGTLQGMLCILEQEFGLGVRAGFEKEFFLLKPSKVGPLSWTGLVSTSYCSSPGYEAAATILDDVYDALASLNIEVEQMHAEGGKGQFELALTHYPALTAADNVLLARETITAIAKKHNAHATFLPKYFSNDIGSGSHVHLSLSQGAVNKLPDEESKHGLSTVGEHFLAGVLHHLPSLLVFTTPHPNSFQRLRPNTWSGAFQCWGNGNKEAALRTVSSPGSKGVTNFELKPIDGMSNPHLALAAIVAAGIDGLRKKLLLPDSIDVNPAELPKGTVKPLPSSLDEAVDALKANETLNNMLGTNLMKAIFAIRLDDIKKSKSADQPEAVLDKLVEIF